MSRIDDLLDEVEGHRLMNELVQQVAQDKANALNTQLDVIGTTGGKATVATVMLPGGSKVDHKP